MELSKLQIYSLGVVAKNKPLTTKVIEVTPIEDAPLSDGELTDNQVRYTASSTNQEGGAYQVDVATTSTIKATWLPMHSSNRLTAPDVRRGEMVVLYRFADTDEYWWATLKDDLHLRKLETVIYAFSGTRDENAKPNGENTYFLEISTHKKLVHFHTSKADGEPFAYDIQINALEGCIVIKDDIGNYFSFDSRGRQLELMNADGTHFDMNRNDLTITVPETFTVNAKTITHRSDTNNMDTATYNGTAGGGDLDISGISHVGHTHGGVKTGPDNTGGPE